jgi:hypothetical protein
MAVFYENEGKVAANFESEFYFFLVEQGKCTSGRKQCTGSMYEYVLVFFDGFFSHEHQTRNAIILGAILCLARVLTWVALKYIRFAT